MPKIRKRKCDERFASDEVRISEKFSRYMRPSSSKECNHRRHSRRHDRRAPKRALLLAQVA